MGIILSQVFRDHALIFAQLRADVFEAGERFDTAQTVIISDRLLQVGRDKSLDNHSTRRVLLIEHTFIEQGLNSTPGKQGTGLISRQQLYFSIVATNCSSHPVAV